MIVDNWKRIIKFSYQFWGNILAAVFSACEFALPYINEVVYIPPKLFLILSFVVIIIANMLRFVAQTNISARPGDDDEQIS